MNELCIALLEFIGSYIYKAVTESMAQTSGLEEGMKNFRRQLSGRRNQKNGKPIPSLFHNGEHIRPIRSCLYRRYLYY